MFMDVMRDYPPRKEDITFVVCGKIIESGCLSTARCLKSIRRFFPESPIILSTWEQESVNLLKGLYDELVVSKEDKRLLQYPSILDHLKRPNTVNVQQVTGFAGVSRVKTTWCVKTRTDFLLGGDAFYKLYLHWNAALDRYNPEYRVFKQRILAPWLFTENPEKNAIAYMLSDFFQFGLTEDLQMLWDGHLESDETLDFFRSYNIEHFNNPEQYNHRYNVEQCFFMNVLRKSCPSVVLPRWYCDSDMLTHLPEIKTVYASNFLFGTFRELRLWTRWTEDEHAVEQDRFIFLQTLLQWYIEYLDPENVLCQTFLRSNPKPSVGRRSLQSRLRIWVWHVKPLRILYYFVRKKVKQVIFNFLSGVR